MVTRFRAWLAKAIANVNRVRSEPILAITLAAEFFRLYDEAIKASLGPEDAIAAAVIGLLGLLGRELVYPAVKVDAATAALKQVEEPLGEPFYPGRDE